MSKPDTVCKQVLDEFREDKLLHIYFLDIMNGFILLAFDDIDDFVSFLEYCFSYFQSLNPKFLLKINDHEDHYNYK
jgi:hypothetical protein